MQAAKDARVEFGESLPVLRDEIGVREPGANRYVLRLFVLQPHLR